jgi:hypothetical protein
MDRPLLESVIAELERIERELGPYGNKHDGWERLRELRLRLDREHLKAALAGKRGKITVTAEEDEEDIEPYDGPIEVDMYFIWLPNNPRAWTHIRVTRIEGTIGKRAPGENEPRIWTARADGKPTGHGYPQTWEVWNEEGRFREACVPADAKGNVLQPVGR